MCRAVRVLSVDVPCRAAGLSLCVPTRALHRGCGTGIGAVRTRVPCRALGRSRVTPPTGYAGGETESGVARGSGS